MSTYSDQPYHPTPYPTSQSDYGSDPTVAMPAGGYTPEHGTGGYSTGATGTDPDNYYGTEQVGNTGSGTSGVSGSGDSFGDSGFGGSDAGSAGEKAAQAKDAGKQAAGEVAGTAKEQAGKVADEAMTQARDVVGQAKGQLREQLGSQHSNLVGNLHQLADQFDRMSSAGDEQTLAHDLVSQAGGHARTAASWLENRQPEDLLQEVRSFARRRPGAFLVGALVAGVAAGRLTRGAVDGHRDGGSDSASLTGGTNGHGTQGYGTQGYGSESYSAQGYGTQGYGTEGYGVGGELPSALDSTTELPSETNGYSTGAPGYGTEHTGSQTGYGAPR